MSERDPTPANSPEAPTRVGRYLLTGAIGAGGMGEVHRARAFGAAGVVKELCVKRIRAARLGREGVLAQFVGEARLWMRMHHGNIVPVFDFGRSGDEYYLAMEWIDGADLRAIAVEARATAAPFSVAEVAHLGAEIARALDYAHGRTGESGRAVVHRDVKPANVLVARTGDVKLTDFGSAARPEPGGGTPAYMAPEQREGCGPVDARADLYALGVTLHELLAGARPGAAALPDDVPPLLASLVRSLCAAEPAARPASAHEVAHQLEDLVAGERAARRGVPPRDALAARAARVADARETTPERITPTELMAELSLAAGDDLTAPTNTLPPNTATQRDDPRAMSRRDDRRARSRRDAAHAVPLGAPAEPPDATAHRASPRLRLLATFAAVAVLGIGGVSLFLTRTNTPPPTRPSREAAPSPTAPPTAARANTVRDPARVEPPLAPPSPPASSPPPALPQAEPPRAAPLLAPPRPPPLLAPADRARQTRRVAPTAPATLDVNAVPWAEVRIDGRSVGTTPLFGLALQPGRHVLRFANEPLGETRETHLEVVSGEHRALVVRLDTP